MVTPIAVDDALEYITELIEEPHGWASENWHDVVNQLETKLKEQKNLEIEDEIAIEEKRGFTWAITLEK